MGESNPPFKNENLEMCIRDRRNSNYDISGQQLNINAYTEIGLGLSRQINSRLTVGARVKADVYKRQIPHNSASVKVRCLPFIVTVGESSGWAMVGTSSVRPTKGGLRCV